MLQEHSVPNIVLEVSGCRAQIGFDGLNNNLLNLQEGKIKFQFNNTEGKDIWVVSMLCNLRKEFVGMVSTWQNVVGIIACV